MRYDNSDLEGKLTIRRMALEVIHGPIRVLDCFAGNGNMYKEIWHRADKYLGIEKRLARPPGHERGECWKGDNRSAALIERAIAKEKFNVIDLDAYGSPWQVFERVVSLSKETQLVITLTCGIQRNLCMATPTPWITDISGTGTLSYSGLLTRWYDDIIRWTLAAALKGNAYKIIRARRVLSGNTNKFTWYWLIELGLSHP